MSAAPVVQVETEEAKNARQVGRMSQVWRWLCGLGVCDTCSSTWAIAQVEKEDGKKFDPFPRKCDRKNRRGETCREIAVAAWKQMPEAGE